MISRQDQKPLCEPRIIRQGTEKLRPLSGAAGIGHIAGDENCVQRVVLVHRLQQLKQPIQALIAARARSPAFNPKSIPFVASTLLASDNIERRLVLDASSSTSPPRGSISGLMTGA
jgi:hypothetical protein